MTRSEADIKRFHAEHKDIILKPLDGMGGMGIFRVREEGLNLGAITETLNKDGAQSLMVQKFLPEIVRFTAAFVDEVFGQIEMPSFLDDPAPSFRCANHAPQGNKLT